jgi:uncharacterized membrane protein
MADPLLLAHIIGGAVGLGSMAVPLVAKKGGGLHVRAGWVFVAGMGLAGVSGAGMAARFFLRDRPGAGVFFGLLSLLLLESLWGALAAVKRKRRPEPSRRPLDLVVPALLGLAGLGGLGYAVAAGRPLVGFFGGLSLLSAGGDLLFALRPLPSPMAWWYRHMASIMVACISAVTAFLVLNVSRLVGPLPREVGWLPWVLPTVITVPLFMRWIRRYRVRFRDVA